MPSSFRRRAAAPLALVALLALPGLAGGQDDCVATGTTGTGGADVLCGTGGADTISGGGGNDRIDGRSGSDQLGGNDGNDVVIGGNGNDVLVGARGNDQFFGQAGNDALLARDGELDTRFSCGDGDDVVNADLVDSVSLGLSFSTPAILLTCEQVRIGAVDEGPNVVIATGPIRVTAAGRAAVRLRCPAALSYACAGRLRLALRDQAPSPAAPYRVSAGRSTVVRARLSAGSRRALDRRRTASARVISVERGEIGAKTTIATVRLSAARRPR